MTGTLGIETFFFLWCCACVSLWLVVVGECGGFVQTRLREWLLHLVDFVAQSCACLNCNLRKLCVCTRQVTCRVRGGVDLAVCPRFH